jgi:hypothetical protein
MSDDGSSDRMICFICQITKITIDQHNSGQIIIPARILFSILGNIIKQYLKKEIFDFKKKSIFMERLSPKKERIDIPVCVNSGQNYKLRWLIQVRMIQIICFIREWICHLICQIGSIWFIQQMTDICLI